MICNYLQSFSRNMQLASIVLRKIALGRPTRRSSWNSLFYCTRSPGKFSPFSMCHTFTATFDIWSIMEILNVSSFYFDSTVNNVAILVFTKGHLWFLVVAHLFHRTECCSYVILNHVFWQVVRFPRYLFFFRCLHLQEF